MSAPPEGLREIPDVVFEEFSDKAFAKVFSDVILMSILPYILQAILLVRLVRHVLLPYTAGIREAPFCRLAGYDT